MSKKMIESAHDQCNLDFMDGMANRMEMSYYSYGDYRKNYRGRYTKKFLRDVQAAIAPILAEYKTKSKGTSAGGNAVVFTLERLLLYLAGGKTRGGEVDAGNTEYLMDAANGLGIEFTLPQVPHARFVPGDDSTSPGFVGNSERGAEVAADSVYRREGD